MKRLFFAGRKKIGQSPGTLVHVGEQKTEAVSIRLMEYDDKGHFIETEIAVSAELASALETPVVTWIDVAGLHQIDTIETIGKTFGIHSLFMEDILNTSQRPKIEQYDDFIYLILKMLHWHPEKGEVEPEQVSIVVGQNFVLTFREQARDIFEPIRQRIRDDKGVLRKMGADYLAYRLLDTVVDHYFLILENIGDQIESLEEELISDQMPDTLQNIHRLKRELLFVRKAVWPLREVIGGLQRRESPLFQEATHIYVRDVYEHTIQVIETVETFRDIVSGLLDIYLSSVSNRMNEVMKVLTVISTIFIPLTFITGLYGMNFRYMPELQWRWAYPLVWLIILAISVGMLVYFRRRKWL
jgi:magnesium transporter